MTIDQIESQLAEDFLLFSDWEDRYGAIIDMGKSLEPMPLELKTDEALVRGCQSQVWLHTQVADGRLYFKADSDALIVRGLVAILVKLYSGQPAKEIAKHQLTIFDRIGLNDHLSVNRSNGLASMTKQIRLAASIAANL